MKISTQATKYTNEHYGSAGDPAQEGAEALVQRIGVQLAAVEGTINFGKRFKGVVIVKVVSCEDHPDADRLHICKVDDGGKTQDVERDEQGLVQVVCGAPNVRAGMLAAWLPPGSTVPSTFDAEPFVLSARAIRGVISNGMMASPKELSLGDSHEGLLEIDEQLGPIAPGTMFVDAFRLRDDVVIDMENKMFTHRPDCFGWLGLAREIEGIHGRPYKSPEWYKTNPEFPGLEADELPLEIQNELPELVPRFTAIALGNIKVGPSPVWLQVDLARAGLRSINNIVDYTNFYMLLTGQPLHAYDYDKVKARSNGDRATLVARHPKQGEKLTLLNGKEIEPRARAIMIATDKELIGVGGVMGGADTEVDETTTNIILEAATFDMYAVRRTSMAHGLFTDAVTRFTKGQSPLQNLAVLWKIADQIQKHAGGKVASQLIDSNNLPSEVMIRNSVHAPVTVTTQFVNERLGWNLSANDMSTILKNVEFGVEVNGDELTVAAPFWRTDIEIPEDVVEEIGRLYGYDKLPLDLPRRSLIPAAKNPAFERQRQIREHLAGAGANEVLTYSFVHGNILDRAGQSREHAFQIANALSPDLQYYRLSLTPSLLDLVHPNIKAGYDEFALFELGTTHCKGIEDQESLPQEDARLGFVCAVGDKKAASAYAGAPYYTARHYLTYLVPGVASLLVPLSQFDLAEDVWGAQLCAPYEPNRSAVIMKDNAVWGVVGEFKPSVRRQFKLPAYAAGFELATELLHELPSPGYTVLSRFPKVGQDITLRVSTTVPNGQLHTFLADFVREYKKNEYFSSVHGVDIYQSDDDATKNVTFRVVATSHERTLTAEEVNTMLDQAAAAAKDAFGAERV